MIAFVTISLVECDIKIWLLKIECKFGRWVIAAFFPADRLIHFVFVFSTQTSKRNCLSALNFGVRTNKLNNYIRFIETLWLNYTLCPAIKIYIIHHVQKPVCPALGQLWEVHFFLIAGRYEISFLYRLDPSQTSVNWQRRRTALGDGVTDSTRCVCVSFGRAVECKKERRW